MSRDSESAGGGRFAVATPHWAATEAAVAALEGGGNSVDAALAASAVLAVVYPHMCGLGGDLFAIVADGTSHVAFNGSGAAARSASPEQIRRRYGSMPEDGPLSITVPGAVGGWSELAECFGRLPLAAAIAPAIEYAEQGVPVAGSLARAIVGNEIRLQADPGMQAVFIPGGRPLSVADHLTQPALGATLRVVADGGASAFYDGPTARNLVGTLSSMGSPLTLADFREHQTERCLPVTRSYGAWEILVPPPNSQGFVLLEILGCLERAGIPGAELDGHAALVSQFFLLASTDRDRFLADPRRVEVPISNLLAADHIDDVIRQARRASAAQVRSTALAGDTVGVVVAQEGGLWVSLNQSLYRSFGSGILDPSTGIICQNRGASFSLDAAAPNYLAGRARPAHTLMPVIVLENGVPCVASATMGGSAHAQIHTHVLTGILDRRLNVDEAVGYPRWLVGGLRPGGGSVVVAESRVDASTIRDLRLSGMPVNELDAWDEQVGHAQVVGRGSDGRLSAASDPRADGTAASG
jgi:gamma-glutamyltranspeptidase